MLQFLVYNIAVITIRILPFAWSKKLAEAIFSLGFWFNSKKRRNIKENLDVVLKTEVSKQNPARGIFALFGRYLVEFLSPSTKKEALRKVAKQEGVHHVLSAYHKGKGVIALTAHLGNWEMAAYMTAKMGVKMSAIFFTHPNSWVDKIFMNHRKVEGLTVIPWKKNATRECLETLKAGRLLAIAGDIDFPGTGLEVELFGKKTKIARGPVVLAKRTGSLIVPGGYVWTQDGGGCLFFDEPIDPKYYTEEELTDKVADALEKMIGRYSEQWFCFEKMWGDGS